MALTGDNPFIAIDTATGLPLPGQDVPVPQTQEEIDRWFAVQRAWAAYNRNGDTSFLREIGLLPPKPTGVKSAQRQVMGDSHNRRTKGNRAIVKLIESAPWREAVTYRETWPHEYVVIKKDGQEDLLTEVCRRFCAGEGVDGRFFRMKNRYLFIGDYKYWLMTPCHKIDLEKDDYVLNRALIYRDRRDFLIRDGDNGRRNNEIDGLFGITTDEQRNARRM